MVEVQAGLTSITSMPRQKHAGFSIDLTLRKKQLDSLRAACRSDFSSAAFLFAKSSFSMTTACWRPAPARR